MLYPKLSQKLTPDQFKNPSSEYRGTPFWAWNNKLDKDELLWQIDQLKKMGYGGFHMHVRTGMATEYLSPEYMEITGACIEKARKENMLAWLYDEDRWPSGAAGGIVTKNPKYRIQHLLLTRFPYGTPVKTVPGRYARATFERSENGELIACFDVVLDKNGDLESYKLINKDSDAIGVKLYAYSETALSGNPWYNNQAYINTLDSQSMHEFIRVTYGAYEKHFKKDFGSLIPAIFTDEPQFSQMMTLGGAYDEKDITLPWTFDIEDSFKTAYNQSLTDKLPELIWNLSYGRISSVRYHYHDHITDRFSAAFAKQCSAWCSQNNIMLTGHMNGEETLESQTLTIGEAMRSLHYFHLPGIDMLCDKREFTTAKQAQSAARQNGSSGVLSELYGVTNWNFDFRGHKLQGDWQVALGVTVRVPHLSWVSMNGEAKRDYPCTFNYQSPWYKEYSYIEDHFARVASAMTRGKAVCRAAVIHPIESFWLHWGPGDKTASIRKEMDEKFLNLCNWLLLGLIDFDYICESTLPLLCKTQDIYGKYFPAGEMKYKVIIVPALVTIRRTTLERLEAFSKNGGRIIFLGNVPEYIDGLNCDDVKKLYEVSQKVNFEKVDILNTLNDIREIEIRYSDSSPAADLLYQLKEEPDGSRWLFIAHAYNPKNPDLPEGDDIRINIMGEWSAQLYNTTNGEITTLPVNLHNGVTCVIQPFYDHDSLLIRLEKPGQMQGTSEHTSDTVKSFNIVNSGNKNPVTPAIHFTGPVPVTLEEPNVLLLDMAEYAIDSQDYRPKEEILRLDNILRAELKWPVRRNAAAQPWVENDTSTPHRLKLRFSFESDIQLNGAELALENAANASVTLNCERASQARGFYVDKCIGKVSLPAIKQGANTLEVSFPYGRKIDVEAMYLLGDFGVNVTGTVCRIIKPVRALSFGDITNQGLPFYGGNIVYHLEIEISGEKPAIQVTNYRGHLLKIKLDSKDLGPLVFSPYKMDIPCNGKGRHKIDIVYYGSRINTFGQLHCVEKDPSFWWGPNSWRTEGAAWSYEYKFWPQGILKSPEITN
ncbi:MAG: hypothetical protein FWC06_00405 [Treponema sp.]|nr:hypothetical protein [Treponema sp.]